MRAPASPLSLWVVAGPAGTVSPWGEIRDIRPPVALPSSVPAWIPETTAVLVLAAGALALWVYLRRRASRPTPEHGAVPASPYLDRLTGLERLPDPELYYELSALVRRALDERFGLGTRCQTTEEVIRSLARTPLADPLRQRVGEFLRRSDPIRYGGAPASPSRREDDLAAVRGILLELFSGTGGAA